MKNKNIKKPWQQQELDLLIKLYPIFTSKKWKNIALRFKQHGFLRTQTQCRQKWVNFLSPEINKAQWTQQELIKLYDLYDRVGNRWCLIQKHLQRPQNNIKNRFYGVIRNFIRHIFRYFTNKKAINNKNINKTPPYILNDIFNSQNQFKFLDGRIKNDIFGMNYGVNKQSLMIKIEQNKNIYKRLYQMLLTVIKCQIKQQKQINSQPFEQQCPFRQIQSSTDKNVVKKQIKIQTCQYQHYLKESDKQKTNINYQNYFPFAINFQLNPYYY